MALSAKTILVTGANRGLGLEFVKQVVKQPNPPEIVFAACRDPTSAQKLQLIAQSHSSVRIVKLDVASDEDIDAAFQEIKSLVGDLGINLLINNAGIYDKSDHGGIGTQTRERLQHHFNVNVTSPILVAQKFLPLLQRAASQGKQELSCSKAAIVNLSSALGSQGITAKEGARTCIHYKCSKTAITMASIVLSQELKKSGILVLTLHPGWVRTDMGTDQAPVAPEESITGWLKVLGNAGEESEGKLISYQGEILPY